MATQQDYDELEQRYYALMYARPPQKRGWNLDALANILIIGILGYTAAVVVGLAPLPYFGPAQQQAAPTVRPQPTQAPVSLPQQAPAQAIPVEDTQRVETAPQAIPTAAVYATAEPVIQVIPQSMPKFDTGPTAIPTLTYPTPLPAAILGETQRSTDGKCVSALRGGKRFEVCQEWKFTEAEAASVADYVRTGLIPGVEVGEP